MRTLLKLISCLGLILTVIPSILYFMGNISQETSNDLMALGMILWFVSAPFWINSKVEKA